jgi:hypothetical protein
MIGSSPTLYPPYPVSKLALTEDWERETKPADEVGEEPKSYNDEKAWSSEKTFNRINTLWMDSNNASFSGLENLWMNLLFLLVDCYVRCTIHNAHMPMHKIVQFWCTFGFLNVPVQLNRLEIRVLSCSFIKCVCPLGQSNWDHDKGILALLKITLTWFFSFVLEAAWSFVGKDSVYFVAKN